MIPFQIAGLLVCSLFVYWAARRWHRRQRPVWMSLLGIVVGLLGALAILVPELTTAVARTVGIARGADLLTYLVALAFLGSWFYFFQRIRILSSAVTILVRELAMQRPQIPLSGLPAADTDESTGQRQPGDR